MTNAPKPAKLQVWTVNDNQPKNNDFRLELS